MAERVSFEEHIARNKRITVFVILFMFTLLFGIIYAVAYILGVDLTYSLVFALALAAGYILFTYSASTQTVLLAAQARPANPNAREEKLLQYRVDEMAIAAGLPPPKVYIQDSRDINAFVTGLSPEKSVLCVTRGALDQLNQEELEGVIGHEMSHIANADMKLATITVGVVGAIAMIAEIGLRVAFFHRGGDRQKANPILIVIAILGIILAPILSRLCYLFLSRRREYLADATGAKLTRNPRGLADALRKIRADLPDDPQGSKTVAGLYIANPWKRRMTGSLWSTHPPLEERIERLESM